MKSLLLIALLGALSALTIQGQTPAPGSPCRLTPAQAPEVRGIRLGMNTENLRRLFPEENNQASIRGAINISQEPDRFGSSHLDLRPDPTAPNSRFADVSFISIFLLDGQVRGFLISYNKPHWENVDQFITRLAESLNLPRPEAWQAGGSSHQKRLVCDNLQIDVTASALNNTLYIHDLSMDRVVRERREAARERERRDFRP